MPHNGFQGTVGIEKINFYGGSMCLNMADLARSRGQDPQKVVQDYMIDTRALFPPWEDAVTLAANASEPMLSPADRQDIGMLIVGTESSVDFGKPISTNLVAALGLGPHVRNFETKHACFSGVAALDVAVNWIAAGLNRGKKALVISSDFSRFHLEEDYEFIMGGTAAALLVSDQPSILSLEPHRRGTWTTNAYDTFRPTARHEIGNNEESLYTYLDAIQGAYQHYCANAGEEIDFQSFFSHLVYHMPFPGMAFQAHRTLTNLTGKLPKKDLQADFSRRVEPSLYFGRKLGSMYGASNFVGLCGHLVAAPDIKAGDRVGFFSYGSGAIGDFYSGVVGTDAVEAVRRSGFMESLERRRHVTTEEYEALERTRTGLIEAPDYEPDFTVPDGLFVEHYRGSRRLVLESVATFRRRYAWSSELK